MSHFRSSALSYIQTGLRSFTITGQQSYRATAYSGATVGGIINPGVALNFGDGTSENAYLKVISIDSSSNVLVGQLVRSNGSAITHTYAGTAITEYEISFFTSARVTTNDSFSNQDYRGFEKLTAGVMNDAPAISVPPVVQVADNTVFNYQLPVFDPEGQPISYRLGTQAEFIGSGAGNVAPAGLTISSTGLMTWDVRDVGGADVSAGQLYTVTAVVSDGKATLGVDFLLSIVSTVNNSAPMFISVPATQNVTVGSVNSVAVDAVDVDGNLTAISVLNPPSGLTTGALHNHSGGSTGAEGGIHVDFRPTAPGTYVVNFQAVDAGGLTAQTSITYIVTAPSAVLTLAGPGSVFEGTGTDTTNFEFVVTRSDTSGSPTATYTITNGTAGDADFGSALVRTGTVTFATGSSTATIIVPVNKDYAIEGDETFTVALSAPQNGTLGATSSATATILNDDVAGTLLIGSPSVVEGDDGTASLVYSIARSAGATGDIDFTLATDSTGTATVGSDFAATSVSYAYRSGVLYVNNGGTLTLAPASQIVVPVSGDYAVENSETVNVSLSAATAGLSYSGGTGTITNDDANYTITQTPFVEGDTGTSNMSFTVTADRAVPVARTVYLTFSGGTAVAGTDYNATPTSVTFAANGTTAQTFTVPVNGDFAVEGNETFNVQAFRVLTGAANYAQQIGTAFTATITDNDGGGTFSVADQSIAEGDTLSAINQFTITRSVTAGSLGVATIDFTVIDGGGFNVGVARNGSDYQAVRSGTISFAGGQTAASIPFEIIGDLLVEGNEEFRIQLSNPSSGTIGRAVGTVTILDNDGGLPVVPGTPGVQQGTIGNDVLISTNQGNSILAGGRGDDTYLVYAQGDTVIEGVNEGQDILYTTVSYSLGENQVEAMSVAQQTSTNAINLIGNYVSQIIVGNYGDNVLNGGSGGVDTLIGLFGNDTYAVGDAHTVIVEQSGQGFDTAVTSVSYTLGAGVSVEVFAAQNAASTTGLRLGGNELAQTIAGTAGADTIAGGGGRDVLLGGAGADTFVIGTVAAGNVAVLADFVSGTDRIGLTSSAFNVGTTLDAAEFVAGTAATTAAQRVIYDAGTGQLFYDADGSGAGAAVLFAQVVPGTAITAASFDVIVPTATAG